MSSSTRPGRTVTVSLFLSYLLVVLLCTPFAVSGRSTSSIKRTSPIQLQTPARYREGEILVRFRDGVSQRDKETIFATHGARRKKQLTGESGFEEIKLAAGQDTKAAVMQLLLNP